jgi:hypothetical protein
MKQVRINADIGFHVGLIQQQDKKDNRRRGGQKKSKDANWWFDQTYFIKKITQARR